MLKYSGCKGAATAIFLTAVCIVSVAGYKGAAIAFFLTAVSMAGCQSAATKDFHTLFVYLSIFCAFLIHFGLPGVPGIALGTLRDHPCAGTPKKVDFGRF